MLDEPVLSIMYWIFVCKQTLTCTILNLVNTLSLGVLDAYKLFATKPRKH